MPAAATSRRATPGETRSRMPPPTRAIPPDGHAGRHRRRTSFSDGPALPRGRSRAESRVHRGSNRCRQLQAATRAQVDDHEDDLRKDNGPAGYLPERPLFYCHHHRNARAPASRLWRCSVSGCCVLRREREISQPGSHPDYSVELEPHLLLGWSTSSGAAMASGWAPGSGIPVIDNGPVTSMNDNLRSASVSTGLASMEPVRTGAPGGRARPRRRAASRRAAPPGAYDCTGDTFCSLRSRSGISFSRVSSAPSARVASRFGTRRGARTTRAPAASAGRVFMIAA